MAKSAEVKQVNLFGEEAEIFKAKIKRYQTMQQMFGVDEKHICKNCVHCVGHYHNFKTYYKCEMWYVSSSSATDIRLKDTACKMYEEYKDEEKA